MAWRAIGGEERRRKLLLINPRFRYRHYAAQHELALLLGKDKVTVPLALPLLAALTPPDWEVSIVDEETEDIPWDERPDLVGITTLAPTVERAYQIADIFRQLGVPVVLGGSYVTYMSDEAIEHADAVVVGEAEAVWADLLADVERSELKPIYEAEAGPVAFESSPLPRWELVDTNRLLNVFVQASRGCPYDCEFCLVNKMFGRKMRCRQVSDVIAEIEASPLKRVIFADDNLTKRKRWSRELIQRIEPLELTWFCQSSVDVADDEDLLELMGRAGCAGIIIGFESLDPTALAETRKKHNVVERYAEAVRRIHAQGIAALGSFVVGFDADTEATLEQIAEFVEATDMVTPMISILAVAPGTDLYDRMTREGRLYGARPAFISGMFPHMHYMQMGQLELMDKYRQTIEELLSFERGGERMLRLARTGWFKQPLNASVGGREKLETSLRMVRRFLLTSNRRKREIFLESMKLVRDGVISPDRLVMFLMNLEAGDMYLHTSYEDYLRVRAEIAPLDRGPWKEMKNR